MDESTIREMLMNHGYLVMSPTGRGVVAHLVTFSEVSAKEHHQTTLCGHTRWRWEGAHREGSHWFSQDPEAERVCSMCIAVALRRGWFHE